MPRFAGLIVNHLPGYEATIELDVEVQLQDEGKLPVFHVTAGASHLLKQEQYVGISRKRHHELLEAAGFFESDDV